MALWNSFATDGIVPTLRKAPPETSLSLLERAQRRENTAWDRLIDLYSPLLNHWCQQSGLQSNDWAEVKQEVFLAIHKYLMKFKRSKVGAFRCWLRTLTRTKVADVYRRNCKFSQIQNPEQCVSDSSVSSESEAEECGLLYRRALEIIVTDFSDTTWQAFWRSTVEEHDSAEVARDLGISRNAVFLAKGRVLRRLQEEFAGLLDDNRVGT